MRYVSHCKAWKTTRLSVERDMHMQKREKCMEMINVKFRRACTSTGKGRDCK